MAEVRRWVCPGHTGRRFIAVEEPGFVFTLSSCGSPRELRELAVVRLTAHLGPVVTFTSVSAQGVGVGSAATGFGRMASGRREGPRIHPPLLRGRRSDCYRSSCRMQRIRFGEFDARSQRFGAGRHQRDGLRHTAMLLSSGRCGRAAFAVAATSGAPGRCTRRVCLRARRGRCRRGRNRITLYQRRRKPLDVVLHAVVSAIALPRRKCRSGQRGGSASAQHPCAKVADREMVYARRAGSPAQRPGSPGCGHQITPRAGPLRWPQSVLRS